jgi:hypothetical protein
MKIPIVYLDFGKLPGDALISRTVALSATQLDDGPDIESKVPVHKFIWPSPIENRDIAQATQPLTDGELTDLNTGHYPWFYLRIQIQYNGGHRTEFCMEYKVVVGIRVLGLLNSQFQY